MEDYYHERMQMLKILNDNQKLNNDRHIASEAPKITKVMKFGFYKLAFLHFLDFVKIKHGHLVFD